MPKSKFCCRAASHLDPVEKIAQYLYLTDPYIYPSICQDPVDPNWVDLIRQCMQADNNIFHIRNLSVIEDMGNIVGVACVIPCGRKLDFLENVQISESFRNKLHIAEEGYFIPLMAESRKYTGHNITNICLDPDYRGKGLGILLLSHCLAEYGTQRIHLDVIASNEAAIQLYKNAGFSIVSKYLGFSGTDTKLPCYHMLYTPKKAE